MATCTFASTCSQVYLGNHYVGDVLAKVAVVKWLLRQQYEKLGSSAALFFPWPAVMITFSL